MKPELTLRPMTREAIRAALQEHWGGLVVTPERTYTADDIEAFVALDETGRAVATVSFHREPGGAEIVTLDALIDGQRYGRRALAQVEAMLGDEGRRYTRLFTTNDNLRAITVYLRMGYRVVTVHLGAMDQVRALKPSVPFIGEDGIPLRDMWELRKELTPRSIR